MLTVSDLQVTGSNLCKMKLKWIISGQRDEQAASKELTQWIAMITEKQRVVAKWRHGNADLCNVIQILKNWALQIFTHFNHSLYSETIKQLYYYYYYYLWIFLKCHAIKKL